MDEFESLLPAVSVSFPSGTLVTDLLADFLDRLGDGELLIEYRLFLDLEERELPLEELLPRLFSFRMVLETDWSSFFALFLNFWAKRKPDFSLHSFDFLP